MIFGGLDVVRQMDIKRKGGRDEGFLCVDSVVRSSARRE